MQRLVLRVRKAFSRKIKRAMIRRLWCKQQRQRLASELGSGARLYIAVQDCSPRLHAVRNVQQLVLAHGMSQAGSLGPQVVREVVTLERRKTVFKADVDEQTGQYACEDEGSEGVNVAPRRPDN